MNLSSKTLIPIGRFSEMTRLSVKALRLCDEKGLLPPAFVDPSTGYRYYGTAQARRAEIIRILRSVDMPLDEIRGILDADDRTLALERLLEHRDRLSAQLAARERMLAYLESIIQQKERIMPYEIDISDVQPQRIAAVRFNTNLERIAKDIQAGFGTLIRGLGRAGVAAAGAPLIVYHDIIDRENDGDVELCVPVAAAFEADGDVYGRELEGGAMATTVHQGPYEQIGPAYQTIMSWIAENGREIAGPPREIYLNDPREVAPEKLLTRIEFPVYSTGSSLSSAPSDSSVST